MVGRDTQLFHDGFAQFAGSGRGVGAYINAYVAHNTQKAQQHDRFAQKAETRRKAGGLAAHLLPPYRRYCQQERGQNPDCAVNGEKHFPAQTEGGEGRRGTPHRDIGSHKGGDGLHKLAESHHTGQLISLNDIGDERVQRGLHQGVADTQQRKGGQHIAITFSEDGHNKGNHRDNQREQHGVFSSDPVHQDSRRDGKDEEPEKDQRRENIGCRIRQLKIGFHIIGGDAHEVHKAHRKKAEHHRNELNLFVHFSEIFT